MDSDDITFYSDLAAVIKPSGAFQELVLAAAHDINENDEEVLTPARSRLKSPKALEQVVEEFKKTYLPKIFGNPFRLLFNQSEITATTPPQLYICRQGTFVFQPTAVFSVFIVFRTQPSIGIKVVEKDDQTKEISIDGWNVASFVIISGKCALKFDGGGKIVLMHITYRRT